MVFIEKAYDPFCVWWHDGIELRAFPGQPEEHGKTRTLDVISDESICLLGSFFLHTIGNSIGLVWRGEPLDHRKRFVFDAVYIAGEVVTPFGRKQCK